MASTTSYGRFGVDVSCVLPFDSPILGFVRQQEIVVVGIHGGRVHWCRWSGCWDLRSTQTSAEAFCCPSPLCLAARDEAVSRLMVADLAGCIGSLVVFASIHPSYASILCKLGAVVDNF